MVKLTPELIQQSSQYLNCVKDRELDLRGYKIPVIENLGATLDQFDLIDFSDNDIRKLDGFPLLKRLKYLFMNNNRIVRFGENLEESLPYIENIVLTNNLIQELGDLDPLVSVKSLRQLSLLHNPVTTKKHYRLYVIYKLPQLKLLDFRKIKMKEREEAQKLFKSHKGKELQKEIVKKSKTFNPGSNIEEAKPKPSAASLEEERAIREAIAKASTLEEIERLNQLLRAGQIPGKGKDKLCAPGTNGAPGDEEEMEQDT